VLTRRLSAEMVASTCRQHDSDFSFNEAGSSSNGSSSPDRSVLLRFDRCGEGRGGILY
jgi:hypothetical protein